jgi:hypothetical protein
MAADVTPQPLIDINFTLFFLLSFTALEVLFASLLKLESDHIHSSFTAARITKVSSW